MLLLGKQRLIVMPTGIDFYSLPFRFLANMSRKGRKAVLWSSDGPQVPVLVLSVHSTSDASLRLQRRRLIAAADG